MQIAAEYNATSCRRVEQRDLAHCATSTLAETAKIPCHSGMSVFINSTADPLRLVQREREREGEKRTILSLCPNFSGNQWYVHWTLFPSFGRPVALSGCTSLPLSTTSEQLCQIDVGDSVPRMQMEISPKRPLPSCFRSHDVWGGDKLDGDDADRSLRSYRWLTALTRNSFLSLLCEVTGATVPSRGSLSTRFHAP